MAEQKFYVTTPIYYVNDKPHIGHAYTTILADVLARYHRSLGLPTFFLTGTDEHGQKVQKAAEKNHIECKQHCDETVVRFKELWQKLGITNDFFIRTTDEFHQKVVSEVLQELYDRGEIYKGDFKGWYCVGDERFFTEKDLVDGKCPECGRDVTEIVESNYFFRMSKHQNWLIEYIESHPGFIQPEFRANETLGFLKKELKDLCISRHKSRLSWGIELPFDRDYVCYVWFDALINYISAVGYRQNDTEFKKWWPASYHLIGKDILTTHTVYWPTMLKAMNVPMPEAIFAHGWWLTGREKMSKSLGNVINPMDMIGKCGVDAFRYFLLAEMSPGQDASFTEAGFINRYNSDLANDLGNLLSRVTKMISRNANGVVPKPGVLTNDDQKLLAMSKQAGVAMEDALHKMQLDRGLDAVMATIRGSNAYLERNAPWTLAKQGNLERLNTVLYVTAEILRTASVLLEPVMPAKMSELRAALGYNQECHVADLQQQGNVLSGCKIQDIAPLFPRYIEEAKAVEPAKAEPVKADKNAAVAPMELISIEQFGKTKLKTAKVLTAERVEGADKLLKLRIDLGGEERQLVAGVAQSYTPEQITGKTIVIVANLQPAKIRGVESQGMLLAAKTGKKLTLVTLDGEVAPGVEIG